MKTVFQHDEAKTHSTKQQQIELIIIENASYSWNYFERVFWFFKNMVKDNE